MTTLLEGLQGSLSKYNLGMVNLDTVVISYLSTQRGQRINFRTSDEAASELEKAVVDENEGKAYIEGLVREEVRFRAYSKGRVFFLTRDDDVDVLGISSIPLYPTHEPIEYISATFDYILSPIYP
ncbi:MAG: hypothetical protein AABX51_05695 [Nanoarchaeota archaeon]